MLQKLSAVSIQIYFTVITTVPIGFELRMLSILGQCVSHIPAVPQQYFSLVFLLNWLYTYRKILISSFSSAKFPLVSNHRPSVHQAGFLAIDHQNNKE
jgi:hypothetical protein